ncbi:MAG: hypothetical protein NC215_00200 [Ruminococcus sp.]|nr:hypothetical protein [Ruminococcus sp.]
MFTKAITYIDYNGTKRTENFQFNFTEAELMELELGVSGGLTENIKKITEGLDGPQIVKIFKKIVLEAYGEKSPDGKRFIKNDELRTAFSQTPAYSQLFMELATDENAAAEFINGLVVQDRAKQAAIASIAAPNV